MLSQKSTMKTKLENMYLQKRISYGYRKVINMMLLSGVISIIAIGILFANMMNYVNNVNAADQAVKTCRININTAARNIREMALNDDESTYDSYEEKVNELLGTVDTQMNVLHGTGGITEDLYTEYKGAFTDWGTIGYEIMEEIKAGKEDQAVDGILNKCTPALNSLVEISKKLDALTDKQRSKAVQSTIFCAVAGIAVIIIFLLLAWAIAKKVSRMVLETILEPLWLHPKTAMTKLPFIGNLNTVFVVAVAMGMGIVLMTMIINVINRLRCHDTENAWFDTNGVAGIVFYGALAATVTLYMTGHALPATAVLVVMFVLPLAVIFFKEPLAALIEKKAQVMPKEKGMFFVQGFFELFEVCLSYFSNTLSFVRVGAFAVSHAAMMEVVLMLSGAEAGNPNWLIVILGNLFVCGMEGLIVGIQVLRLEYYELFSRFYKGTGREFRPYGKKEQAQ